MKSILIFLSILQLTLVSCAPQRQTVSLYFEPETITDTKCPPHPEFKSFNIKKIAVMAFQDSDRTLHEKFYPHASFNIQPYDAYTYLPGNDGQIVSGITERVLLNSYKYNIIERRDLTKLLEEQKFQSSGLVKKDDIIEMGNLLGVDAILTGKVIDAFAHFEVRTIGDGGSGGFIGTYVAYVSLEMRLVHVKTGQVIWFCVLKRNSMNYLDKPLRVTNHEVLRNLHLFNKPLHGSTPKERLLYIIEQTVKEAIENI